MDTLDTQELQRLLTLIRRERPELCAGHFTSQPAEWDGLENPFIRLCSQRSAVQAYDFKLDPSFDKLYTSNISSRSRSALRRKERKLHGSGKLSIGLAETSDQRVEIFEDFLRQKALQFKAQGIRNLFADPYVRDFYREIFAGNHSGAPFECAYIRVGEELVATFTGIRFKDRFYYLISSMTLGELRRWSPGLILMKEVIARQCQHGAMYFDLGPGQGMHKDMWKGSEIPLIETHLSFRAKSWPITVARRAATQMKLKIKNRPAFLQTARGIRQVGRLVLRG
jgi:CelD/BcsL family acetyltransferase involved in cellulose biosynthesis